MEAEKAFGSGQAEALEAEEASVSKTFEPGEGIVAAEAAPEQGILQPGISSTLLMVYCCHQKRVSLVQVSMLIC